MIRITIPLFVGACLLCVWEAWVILAEIPRFILPAPSAICAAMVSNFTALMAALWVTVIVTATAFGFGRYQRRRFGDPVHPRAAYRNGPLPLCRYPASHAGCCHCAAYSYLGGLLTMLTARWLSLPGLSLSSQCSQIPCKVCAVSSRHYMM